MDYYASSFNGGMFTAQGRIEQVVYANECAASSAPSVGIICREGIIFATINQLESKLVIGSSVKNVIPVSDTIGMTYSGLQPDFRIVSSFASKTQILYNMVLRKKIDVFHLVTELSKSMQQQTHERHVRPYGLNLLVGGLNYGPRYAHPSLFRLTSSGDYSSILAGALGNNADEMHSFLAKRVRATMGQQAAIRLAMRALIIGNGEEFPGQHIEVSTVTMEGYHSLTLKEIEKHLCQIIKFD